MNIWHDISPKVITKEKFTAVIEIPKGTKVKYELDKTTGLLLIRQSADLKIGPPKLVGPGDLHILRLDIDLVAGGLGKGGTVD